MEATGRSDFVTVWPVSSASATGGRHLELLRGSLTSRRSSALGGCASMNLERRMDAAYVSACFGLAGATIGGLTSFTTTWLTQRAQAREKREESSRANRQAIFNEFIIEASRLYGDALSHEKDDVCDLVQLYAIVGKMRLWASSPVVHAAQQAMDVIINTYLEPNRGLHEIRAMAQEGKMNFLLDFGESCRTELSTC